MTTMCILSPSEPELSAPCPASLALCLSALTLWLGTATWLSLRCLAGVAEPLSVYPLPLPLAVAGSWLASSRCKCRAGF